MTVSCNSRVVAAPLVQRNDAPHLGRAAAVFPPRAVPARAPRVLRVALAGAALRRQPLPLPGQHSPRGGNGALPAAARSPASRRSARLRGQLLLFATHA